ncbi:MAG: VWA domain-containing protein [Vicinamibacteria bacterium]
MTAALALWLLALAGQEQEIFEFRVDVTRVYVDVFVSRQGKAVSDLEASNFEVYDNGVRQQVELTDAASVPKTFALLLDESGSITGRKQHLLEEALLDFTGRLSDKDELTVLSFAERAVLRHPLAFARPDNETDAYRIKGGGWTAFNDALFLTLTYLRNAKGRPILVVFTDGMDNTSWIGEEAVLESARSSEAVIYAVKADVGTGAQVGGTVVPAGSSGQSAAMLDELTRMTGGLSLEAGRADAISAAFQGVLSDVSTRYLLTFSPGTKAKPGLHELIVRIGGVRDVEVRARASYFMPSNSNR